MNHKFILIAVIILLIPVFVCAESFDISIKYLGISVVKVKITNEDSTLSVQTRSTFIASIASNMSNQYTSEYTGNYLPFTYQKQINQGDYFEDRIVKYDRQHLTAQRISSISSERNSEYEIKSESRDFFSALFYLREAIDETEGEMWVDANKLIWNVQYTVIGKEIISTKLGKINTIKVKLNFQKYSNREKERSDMLTNNLVNEERSLIFWFSDDEQRLPVKAKFLMKPFAVVWKLNSYKK